LGACDDGGYYLLGMTATHAGLFTDIAWSTDGVAEATRARALGLEVVELEAWHDVDDAASLATLLAETGGYAAPATRAAVGRLGLRGLLPAPSMTRPMLALLGLGGALLGLTLGALALDVPGAETGDHALLLNLLGEHQEVWGVRVRAGRRTLREASYWQPFIRATPHFLMVPWSAADGTPGPSLPTRLQSGTRTLPCGMCQ